jgi:hypothetical protein
MSPAHFHNFSYKQKLTLAGSLFRRYAPFTASLLATSLQSYFTFAAGKNFTPFRAPSAVLH